jgi:DNA repair protein RecN (Recombination protein N)
VLKSLKIQNYALIDSLNIDFNSGFTVLTGETGAGKSIIVGSLGVILGERTSSDYIRTGEERAVVEAVFETGRESLSVLREISASGKNQARVNGKAVTQAALKEITKGLIDIHGQHEHQSLLEVERHIDLLDNLGGEEVLNLKEGVAADFNRYAGLKNTLSTLEKSKEERERHVDFLKFQIKEIDEAQVQSGEEEELEKERAILANASRLAELSSQADQLLSGENFSVSDNLKSVLLNLKTMSDIDSSISPLKQGLEESIYQIEDVVRELSRYQEKIELNPNRLTEVEDRLDLIHQLKRKYGDNLEEYSARKLEELKAIEVSDDKIDEYRQEMEKAHKDLKTKSLALSKRRKALAGRMEKEIKDELAELAMDKTAFKVNMKEVEPGPKGGDEIEFMISPNPGEPLKPLAKIASGGEISRVMLALKSILVSADQIPTMIFDEIDVGIGGQTAVAVGKKLFRLSRKHQVICITHLPQIASQAENHLRVSKEIKSGRTMVGVEPLSVEKRIEEIAKLVSGKVSEKSLKTAEEMLGVS